MNSGIYTITNPNNGKFYIGSSQNLSVREYEHFHRLKNNKHKNNKFQNAWNATIGKNFSFCVLLYCEKEELLYYEQWFLDSWNPQYNIAKDAIASMRGLKQSNKTKKLLSKKVGKINKTKRRKEDTAKANKKRVWTEEARAKISEANRNKVFKQETLDKHSRNSSKTYYGIVSPEGTIHPKITNLKAFCKKYGLTPSGMYRTYQGQNKQHKGWTILPR